LTVGWSDRLKHSKQNKESDVMKSSIPRRGLQEIRTLSGRISAVDNPQKKYMAMAMLELERARRNKEKQSAGQRVTNINQRLADISAEQTSLLAQAKVELAASRRTRKRKQAKDTNSGEPSGSGFKLAY
jgi:hypothetical protein